MASRLAERTFDLPGFQPIWRPYALAIGLLFAAGAALLIDVPVAQFCQEVETTGQIEGIRVPRDLRKVLALCEIFGHASGVTLVCLAWFVLDRTRRWSLPRVLACTFGAGILADLLKPLIGRHRPNGFDFSGGGVADTFIGWIPALQSADWTQAINRQIQSCPSGHSAMAVSLAVVLGSFYPHARWLFALLASLALMQRVESGAHFVSDTLVGAALGCVWAGLCVDRRVLGRLFERIEKKG